MSHAGNAIVLATALYAVDPATRQRQMRPEMIDSLYDAVSCARLSEDAKADVYATLAEKLTPDTPFTDAVNIITEALERAPV